MNTPTIFVLPRIPWDAASTIRLCVPAIDGGHAVFLEASVKGDIENVESLAKNIAASIGGNLRYEE